jgi:hypothetical protein
VISDLEIRISGRATISQRGIRHIDLGDPQHGY